MEPYDLLKYMVKAFESLGIRYFITGSIASIFYGEPRFTNDIDVVADTGVTLLWRRTHIRNFKTISCE